MAKALLRLVVPGVDDPENAAVLELPDVSAMTLPQAAMAYATHGWYVLPTAPGDIKNPGSVVGGKWHQRSSRAREEIEKWWSVNPDFGIALHVGRSGAGVFDLDMEDLSALPPEIADALGTARAVQGTRRDGDRGHFIFCLNDGDNFGNAAGGFARYGDYRGRNGVIIAAPTPHPDADTKGGLYVQRRIGLVGPMPKALRECLSAASADADPKTPAELDAFLAAHAGEDRPQALKGPLSDFAGKTGEGASRHETMCETLCWAFREALAGAYPAQTAYDELRDAFAGSKPEAALGEFDRMAQWAAAQAELADPAETLARMDRNLWPAPQSPVPVARNVARRAESAHEPVRRWRHDWYRWTGTRYRSVTEEALKGDLYRMLENAWYLGPKDQPMPWHPDKTKVSKLLDALPAIVGVGDDVDDQSWLDGRADRVIAFRNGLLRVGDRKLLAHTPDYFNTMALDFDYTADAPQPVRWMEFLCQIFNTDSGDVPEGEIAEAIECLQDWFGYLIDGKRTEQHKALMLTGPPRSGKGTVAAVIEMLLGAENVAPVTAKNLVERFGLWPLIGKRVALFPDTKVTVRGNEVSEQLLDLIANDPITADRKLQKPWRGRLGVVVVMMGNGVPRLPDNAGAISARFITMQTKQSFVGKENRKLLEQLAEEIPGIMNWALVGLDRLNSRNELIQPRNGEATKRLLWDLGSPLRQFVDEMCTLDPDASEDKDVLYQHWRSWCTSNGHIPQAKESFYGELITAFGARINPNFRPRIDGKQLRRVQGMRLNDVPQTRFPVPRGGGR